MTISAYIESRSFASNMDALSIYLALRARYQEEGLFLMESLSSHNSDKQRSVIGFEPIMTVSVTEHIMTVDPLGNSLLSEVLKGGSLPGRVYGSDCDIMKCAVPDIWAVFRVLRSIESIFAIHGEQEGSFGMGWFGYFGYDTIFMIEDLVKHISRNAALPVISLTLYQGTINLDNETGERSVTVISLNKQQAPSSLTTKCQEFLNDILDVLHTTEVQRPDRVNASLDTSMVSEMAADGEDRFYSYKSTDTVNRKQFYRWFASAKEHIAQGDVYQIQLGHEIQVDSCIPPFDVYRHLRQQDPSPYMYYFVTPQGVHVIGASPELFIGLTPNGRITVRPIAGTVGGVGEELGRGDPLKSAISHLTGDPKERAEHLMLVDLGRNDVARCCTPESLKVNRLMTTEVYSHVIHMVSDVVGRIRPGLDKYDVLAAAFPAGTMTGTPKVRAVEIIEETEVSSRGVYAGAVGFLGFDGMVLTALCIRTASYRSGSYHLRASAGIVEDSQPESEWQETMKKMSSAYLAITGRELAHEGLAD